MCPSLHKLSAFDKPNVLPYEYKNYIHLHSDGQVDTRGNLFVLGVILQSDFQTSLYRHSSLCRFTFQILRHEK